MALQLAVIGRDLLLPRARSERPVLTLAVRKRLTWYDSRVICAGDRMKRFVEGADRGQSTLLPECLDDWIGDENPVRVIDVFVDELVDRI